MKISSLKAMWVSMFPEERNLTITIDNKLNLWKKERKTVRMFSKAWKHFISTFWKLPGFKTIFHEKLFWASLKLPQNRTLNEIEKIIPDLWISQAFTWVKKGSWQLHESMKGTVSAVTSTTRTSANITGVFLRHCAMCCDISQGWDGPMEAVQDTDSVLFVLPPGTFPAEYPQIHLCWA